MTAPCPDCGDEQRTRSRPAARTTVGAVTAAADPRTTVICEHACAQAEERLGAELDRALEAGLPFGRGRPGAPCCAACEEPLDLPMRATLRSVTVEPAAGPPFTLTFALPLVRCGECGTDNVPPGLVEVVRSTAREVCRVGPSPRRRGPFSRLRRHDGRGSRGAP